MEPSVLKEVLPLSTIVLKGRRHFIEGNGGSTIFTETRWNVKRGNKVW